MLKYDFNFNLASWPGNMMIDHRNHDDGGFSHDYVRVQDGAYCDCGYRPPTPNDLLDHAKNCELPAYRIDLKGHKRYF